MIGNCCHKHFEEASLPENRALTTEQRQAIHDACADCVEADRVQRERVQRECTIDPSQPYGEHILLRCADHPDLRWTTKNIDFIGARSIFYVTHGEPECTCPAMLLEVVKS